jgi:uncharacterized protein with von Willebrand factor type A (vWA) domain
MIFRYQEFDGEPFAGQEALSMFEGLMEFVLEYGDNAMDALEHLEQDPEKSELLQQLADQGLLEKMGAKWRLTPRAINAMQRRALMEVFAQLRRGHKDGHEAQESGQVGERAEGTRPYQFGDPVSELDLHATLRNTIKRVGPGTPIRISERDFELNNLEDQTSVSTVILLDMSGSMARYHRFYHAKKCAMAMHALITQRFPQDTVDVVGFYSAASVIPDHKLPLVSPKPVTIFDYEVRMRVPLDKAEEGPQHFTNLHMGLLMAKRILARRGGDNKQVFIITDGQPTAHLQGDYLYLLYPPEEISTITTLREAIQLHRQGIRICTFALTEDYEYLDWVGFVDQLTRLTKGVAFYCAGGDLANCLMDSYLSGRKQRAYIS